jgi:F-type H+-transporting ATPase subunit c
MDPKIISIIGAAIAVSIGSIGPALGEGRSIAAAMDAIARQPRPQVPFRAHSLSGSR